MVQIYVENPRKIIQNQKEIEKALEAKISIKENLLEITAKPEDEILATEVIEAINLGFKVNESLLLKDEEFSFKKMDIKKEAKRGKTKEIRSRIIGRHGKALKTIKELTDCLISIHGNIVGIIGQEDKIGKAERAVKKLIRGSKHGKVYSFLEKNEI